MKKLILIISMIIIAAVMSVIVYAQQKSGLQKRLDNSLLRLHIIAESNSTSDQYVKLKVRDALLVKFGDRLNSCKNREEAIKLINGNIKSIEAESNRVLKSYGKNYSARGYIGEFYFPDRTYGSITLPEGNYKALRVVLGDGKGKNWWCVMFPALCYVKDVKGNSEASNRAKLKSIIGSKDLNSITGKPFLPSQISAQNKTHSGPKHYEFRLKFFDRIKSIAKIGLRR